MSTIKRRVYSPDAFIREIKIRTGFEVMLEEIIGWCTEGLIQASFLYIPQSDQMIAKGQNNYDPKFPPIQPFYWTLDPSLSQLIRNKDVAFDDFKEACDDEYLPEFDFNLGGYIFYIDKRTFHRLYIWDHESTPAYVCNCFYPNPYHSYQNADTSTTDFLYENGLSIFYKNSNFDFFNDIENAATATHIPITVFKSSKSKFDMRIDEYSPTFKKNMSLESFHCYECLFFEKDEINNFIKNHFYSTHNSHSNIKVPKQLKRELYFKGWIAGQNRNFNDIFPEKRIDIWNQLSKENPNLFPEITDPENKTMARFFSNTGAKFQ